MIPIPESGRLMVDVLIEGWPSPTGSFLGLSIGLGGIIVMLAYIYGQLKRIADALEKK